MGAQADHCWHDEVASLLAWWRDAGVDVLVDDAPRDWLAPLVIPAAVTETRTPPAAPTQSLPTTLEAFAAWRTGPDCPEARWDLPLIAPQNIVGAALMVVVDLPDGEDVAAGSLLAGAPGRLFERMLAAVGLDREKVAITALALARPVTGQVPAADAERLAAITRHHIALLAPERVLLLGQPVSRALFGAEGARKRGHLHGIKQEEREFPAIASYHPRFLLQRPAAKAESWRDLQTLFGGKLR